MAKLNKMLFLTLIVAMILFSGSITAFNTYAKTNVSGTNIDSTTEESTDDQAENDDEYTEDDGDIEYREIDAETVREPIYRDDSKTRFYYDTNIFWKSLMNRDAKATTDDLDLNVVVSGELPEDITAEFHYITLDESNTYSEKGILSFEVMLYDEDGEVYKPDEPVEVCIQGDALEEEIKDENSLILYSYAEDEETSEYYSEKYDKNVYAADVDVYKSSNVDDNNLKYDTENQDEAVIYTEVEEELQDDEDSVTFEYDYDENRHFVLSSQMKTRILKATSGENTITAKGFFGENVTLKVNEIPESNKSYDKYIKETEKALKKDDFSFARAFDIKLVDQDTGEEFQPDSDVNVMINLKDENVDDEGVIDVVHFADKKPEVVDSKNDDNKIKFTVDGFSVYVITYTVDFHWGDYTYSISGNESIKLSKLLKELKVEEISIDDVEDVSFSNEKLVEVKKLNDDWLLTSKKAFTTEEKLTLYLKNGKECSIKVTDETFVARVSNDNGENWTYFQRLVTDGDEEGAFDYVKPLKGSVIIETLLDESEYYTLPSATTIGTDASSSITSLTIRSADGVGKSLLKKGYDGGPILTIYLRGCTTTFENLIIDGDNKQGTSNGGAIYFQSTTKSPSAIIKNVEFKNCKVTNGHGGAIYNSASLSIQNSSFENCFASSSGGAIYGSTTIQDCSFTDCQSVENGGAINANTATLKATEQGSVLFDSCSATSDGGAIIASTVNMNNNEGNITFKNCQTTGEAHEGGAIRSTNIYAKENAGTILFKDCTTSGSTSEGSAMFVSSGTIQIENTGDGTAIFDNCVANAVDGGGAICVWSSGTLILKGTEENPIQFTDCKTTTGNGGAIFSVSTTNLSHCIFDGCEAKSYGGAVVHNGEGTITDCVFRNIKATTYAGAIRNGGTANYSRCTFTNCTSGTYGGAIEGNGGEITDCSINDCSANTNGGAVYGSSGTLNISNTPISNCTATNNGGAIYESSGTVSYSGGNIKNCSAIYGGAAYSTNGTLNISDTPISDCTATNNGGAIYESSGTVGLSGNNIKNCYATNGGAIYESSGTLNVSDTTISDCTVTTNGGAFYINSGTVSFSGGNIKNCSATNGGAVYGGNGTQNISNTPISDCTATTNGGAIYESSGTLNISDTPISDCTATTNGGAFYINSGTVSFSGGNIKNCTAKLGSAVYANGTMILDGGEVTDNTVTNISATAGGAMETTTSGVLRFKGKAKVHGNKYDGGTGRNVLIKTDRNGTICADGLSSDAEVNVFVIDNMRAKHGNAGRSFAIRTNDDNLDRFINERFTASDGEHLTGVATTNYYGQKEVCWKPEEVVITAVSTQDSSVPISGAKFEIYCDGWNNNSIVWRGTTDDDGKVRITWTGQESELTDDADGGGTSFIYDVNYPTRQYALRQVKTANGYALPGGVWKINDYDAAGFKATTVQNTNTNYTRDMTISNTSGIDTSTCGVLGTKWLVKNDNGTMKANYVCGDGAQFDGPNPQTFSFSTDSIISSETITEEMPTKQGNRFIGWNTQADGKGTAFASGGPIWRTNEGNITLYAQWAPAESIARVSFDNGTTWQYFEALITGTYDGETVNGAFDYAKNRISTNTGTVIIETLLEEHPRYTLDNSFSFTGTRNSTTLIIRTTEGLGSRSKIVKNQTSGPIISSSLRYNTLRISNLIFDGNDKLSSGSGGAIYQGGDSGGGVFITNCDFINCKTKGNGGAVYVASNRIEIKNTMPQEKPMRFEGCTSDSSGGAIYASVPVTISNETKGIISFKNCIGGANGAVSCTTATITNTKYGAVKFDGCQANNGSGGAINVSTSFDASNNNGKIEFSECEASNSGGAIYTGSTTKSTIDNNNGSISFNECKANSGSGGAICLQRNFSAENNSGNLIFKNCSAKTGGGAIYSNIPNSNYTIPIKNEGNGKAYFANCSTDGNGGAICINYGKFVLFGTKRNPIKFINCYATNGGGTYSGPAEMTNIVFGDKNEPSKACTASGSGGAVYSGSLNYTNESNSELGFYYSEATTSGGAVHSTGSVTINSKDSVVFETCKTKNSNGGAICNSGEFVINNEDSVIFNICETENGNGGAVCSNGTFSINNKTTESSVSFEQCKASKNMGGAVYCGSIKADNNKGTIRFNVCESEKGGGAVYASTTTLSTIENNVGNIVFNHCKTTSSGNGGAIHLQRGLTVNNNRGTLQFNDCSANGDGGVIYSNAPNSNHYITIKNEGNGNTYFTNCNAIGNGGAICINLGRINLSGSKDSNPIKFINCHAVNGGVAYSSSTVEMTNVVFGDKNEPSKACTASGSGGAVYSGSFYYTNESNSELGFYYSEATTSGGAVHSTGSVTINSNGSVVFETCKVETGNGGAIQSGGDVVINNEDSVIFNKCETENGNGGAVCSNGTFSINNKTTESSVSFEQCKASKNMGGAVYCGYIKTDGNKGTIHFNICESGKDGGAVYANATTTSTIDNNTGSVIFEHCKITSSGSGGAIFFQRRLSISNNSGTLQFNDCSAKGNGGALYMNDNIGDLYTTITNKDDGEIEFTDCNATGIGGAIYTNRYRLTITGVKKDTITFKNCHSNENGGGGIYCGTASLSYVEFGDAENTEMGCSAPGEGGALNCTTGTLNNVLFNYCSTPENGGAVKFEYSSEMNGCSAIGCSTGQEGSVAYIPSGYTLTIKNGRYTGNTASGTNGGAFNTEADNNSSSHFCFEGNVYIYGNTNTNDSDETQRNVVLSVTNRTSPIQTINNGLGNQAKIGIYVLGDKNTNPYANHGQLDNDFGTFSKPYNLSSFVNDRDTKLFGDEHGGTNYICWSGSGVCKLTDGSDTLLYKNQGGTPALFGKLAFATAIADDTQGTLYYKNGDEFEPYTGDEVKLKLLSDFEVSNQDVPTYSGTRKLTITTAETADENTDGYPYVREAEEDPYEGLRSKTCASVKRTRTGSALISINTNAEVTIENLLFDGNNMHYEGDGGCFYFGKTCTVNLKNVLFENFASLNGGVIYGANTLNIKVKENEYVKFINCNVTRRGGAINIYGNDSMINNEGTMIFDKCKSSRDGGAIYLGSNSITINNTEMGSIRFNECSNTGSGYYGGAIYAGILNVNDNRGAIHFKQCTSKSYGGAIYAGTTANINNNNGPIYFEQCVSTDSSGGAIYTGTLNINNNKNEIRFKQCNSLGSGGAILGNTNVNINNNESTIEFDECYTKGSSAYGGVIYASYGNLNMNGNNGQIKFNECYTKGSNADGGAIASQGGSSKVAIKENNGTIQFVKCRTENSGTQGGAIYTANSSEIDLENVDNGQISFTDCYVESADSSYGGGAICGWNGSHVKLHGTKNNPILFENCSTKSNGGGGAIKAGKVTMEYVDFGKMISNDEENIIDDEKKCYAVGGVGGAVASIGDLSAEKCNFYGSSSTGNGGALYSSAKLELSNCKFYQTVSNNSGGAVYQTGGYNVTVIDSDFTDCKATSDSGGIYTSSGSSVSFERCNFTRCYALNNSSGAINETSYTSKTTIQECSFTDCKSAKLAGALTLRGKNLIMKDSDLIRCCGTSDGKEAENGSVVCVYNNSTNIDIIRCYFDNEEKGKSDGGTLYICDNATNLNILGSEFVNSKSEGSQNGYGGGAIYARATKTTIGASEAPSNSVSAGTAKGKNEGTEIKSVFNNCQSTKNGGAVYARNVLNLDKTDFIRCSSSANGGAVYSSSDVTIANPNNTETKFERCTAVTGGAICSPRNIYISGKKTLFDHCESVGAGGAIKMDGTSYVLNIRDAEFRNCKAGSGGGAIYANTSAAVTLTDDIFNGCEHTCESANGGGGAVWKTGTGTLTVTDSLFENCKSSWTNQTSNYYGGSAVYVNVGNAIFKGTDTESGQPKMRIMGCQSADGLNNNSLASGGAINTGYESKSNYGKLTFEGDVYIQDNTDLSNEPRNVVLSYDRRDLINTTESGLSEDASIGVYVPNAYFATRGDKYKEFGTFKTNIDNLDSFTNDRLPLVGGEKGSDIIVWTTAYRLNLDPNGGEGTPISVVLTYYKEYTLGTPYTKEDYHFAGWNTRKDGTGESFEASDIVSQLTDEDGGEVTLYAQWEQYDACTIHFHPNGGTEVPSRDVKPGTKLGLLPSSSRDHYTFVRWMLLNEDGEEESYSIDTEVNSDLHFYAVWEKRVIITFDARGGIVGEDSREISPGKIGSLPRAEQPAETKKDYEFVHWYRLDDEGEKVTVTEDTVFTEDDTLYAEWKTIPRKLRYNTNGGNPGKNPETKDYWYDSDWVTDLDEIMEYTVKGFPTITNHGYTLVGWYTSDGVKVEVGDKVDLRDVHVLSAKWTRNEPAVITFDSDGGTLCDSIEVIKGDALDRYPTSKKDGFTFSGWYLLDENGELALDNGKPIEVNTKTRITESITVRAKWISMATVTFDSDGGTAYDPIKVDRGKKIAELPKPEKQGYVFEGWYDTEIVPDPQTGEDTVVIKEPEKQVTNKTNINDDMLLKAKWAKQVTVTFNWVDLQDEEGNTKITSENVISGRRIGKVPGTYQNGYIVEGWYPNVNYEGEKLTEDTIITEDCTYYAKWVPYKESVTSPIEYEYNIVWTNESSETLTNENDRLIWHVDGKAKGNVSALAYVSFSLIKTEGKTIPQGGIQINVPKYVFEDENGNAIPGKNNIVTFIPEYPEKRGGLDWNYKDNGDYYTLLNTEETNNLTLDLNITYTADIKDIKSAKVDKNTGVYIDENGDVIEHSDYTPRENPFYINVRTSDGTVNNTHTKSLYTEAYKYYKKATYSASYTSGTRPQVMTAWNAAWGEKPADADKYYYVKWYHGHFYIIKYGDLDGNANAQFTTTSREWVENSYETVYEDPNGEYLITRHPYSELVNNQKNLYKSEISKGKWVSGETETEERTIYCEVDFRVGNPSDPPPSQIHVNNLNASKSFRYYQVDYKGHRYGQDSLLDGEVINDDFYLTMTGPGENNVIQKGDTGLYNAKEYTMFMRDGEPGDLTYTSTSLNKHVKLGDNDYRFTKLTVEMKNDDGYMDESGWHKLENTAYSSWRPVEVWVRDKGKLTYYKYTDVYIRTGAKETIDLPENAVGFELRHTTTYWGTELSVNVKMKILSSSHVKKLVQADYINKIESRFYNFSSFKAVSNETNEVLGQWTDSDYFKCGKTKTGLRTEKTVRGNIGIDNNKGEQVIQIRTSGYHENSNKRVKPIYSGIFYELLPLGTIVDEASVKIDASGTDLSRNMYTVEYEQNWKSTGQTMMIVTFGVPSEIKAARINLNYELTSTYENILSRGAAMETSTAFVNTSEVRELYELTPKVKPINQIKRGTLLYGELEEEYGEYVAYNQMIAEYEKINAYSSSFNKLVNTLNVFTSKADIISYTPYTYRLKYSQSMYMQSDNVKVFDLLEKGKYLGDESEYISKWQGTLQDIRVSTIESSADGKICDPVIYYSTIDVNDIDDLPRDLTNEEVWTTVKPDGHITAIAIDFSKATDGTPFVMRGSDTIVADINMLSPSDDGLVGESAVNTAIGTSRIYEIGADPEESSRNNSVKSQAMVTMKPSTETIRLTSNPTSGTPESPRLVAHKDTVEYDISVNNSDKDFVYRNIKIEDLLPDAVSPEMENIYIYINDDKENAVKIGRSARADVEKDSDGKLNFTVNELLQEETLHIVIPCIVNATEGKFENRAKLVKVNGMNRNKFTGKTYHEVKKYPVEFSKKILDANPEQFLKGAELKVTDSSGHPVDDWISSDESGEEYHVIRLGAGEYTFIEEEAPNNYATANPIKFTVSREGEVTVGKQKLNDRKIDMYDKYDAVDVVVKNRLEVDNPDTTKEFNYTIRINGLKPGKKYSKSNGLFIADTYGSAILNFTLKHDETMTFEKLPSGASVKITQNASEYVAYYTATAIKGETSTVLSRGENSLNNQALTTEVTEVNIDEGETLHFLFENKKLPDIPIRFIVLDKDDNTPISGAEMKFTMTSPQPEEGEFPFEEEWASSDKHKTIGVEREATYTVKQISVPEQYMSAQTPFTLTVSEDGVITCSDEQALVKDSNGYIVKIFNKKRAKLIVENIGKNTSYYLAGAKFELKENDETLKNWTSAGNKGETMYLDLGKTYQIKKTESPNNYAAVPPSNVQVIVDSEGNVTVDEQANKAKVFDRKTNTLTFYDRYVKTLTITNIVEDDATSEPFGFVIDGLKPNQEVTYIKNKKKENETSGNITAGEDGKITFELLNNDTIDIKDLPDDFGITETKPEGTCFMTEWKMNKKEILEADDDFIRSIVSVNKHIKQDTIEVTNKIEGTAFVTLVKILDNDGVYQTFSGKTFTVYSDSSMKNVAVGKMLNSGGSEKEDIKLQNLTSGEGGAFFIGELPYRTYYVKEDGVNGKHFEFTVDEGGVVYIEGKGESKKTTPRKTVELVSD